MLILYFRFDYDDKMSSKWVPSIILISISYVDTCIPIYCKENKVDESVYTDQYHLFKKVNERAS